MNKVLIVVNTPYQLMVAIRITETMHKSDEVDLFVGNTIANTSVLIEKIKTADLFHSVRLLNKKAMDAKVIKARVLLDVIAGSKWNLLKNIGENLIDDIYNTIYLANIDTTNRLLYKKIKDKSNGMPCKVCLFEDGYATYSECYGNYFSKIEKYRFKKGFLGKLRRKYNEVYYSISEMFLFSKDLLDWKPNFQVSSIEKIGKDEIEYKRVVNTVFQYELSEDKYEENYIFFEESYFADGVEINDVEIVNKLTQIIEKDSLFVKIHPRNPSNRFRELGYHTNCNTDIPWEVIANNINLQDKVLLTIASGSALTSLVNMSSKPKKIIMLMNCEEIDQSKLTPSLPTLQKIAEIHSDVVVTPRNFEDIRKIIEDININLM